MAADTPTISRSSSVSTEAVEEPPVNRRAVRINLITLGSSGELLSLLLSAPSEVTHSMPLPSFGPQLQERRH
jgi:hypothetical protein